MSDICNSQIPLSALIITHDEQKNIRECLESLLWIDEIIIIDDFSEDETLKIAKEYPQVKVFSRKLDDFSSQRNFGLQQCSQEWILVIDADERVTTELKKEILTVLNSPTKLGYRIPRKNFFMGHWLRSIYPDYTLRLFNKRNARYQGNVHESAEINGPIGYLKSPFLHYTYNNIEQMIQKANQYTSMGALELYEKGKRAKVADILLRPFFTFIKHYFLKRGILDGLHGFIFALLSAYNNFIKYIKLYFLKETEK